MEKSKAWILAASLSALPPTSGCGDCHYPPWPGCSCSYSYSMTLQSCVRARCVDCVCRQMRAATLPQTQPGLGSTHTCSWPSQHEPAGGWRAQEAGLITQLSCTIWLTRHLSGPRQQHLLIITRTSNTCLCIKKKKPCQA